MLHNLNQIEKRLKTTFQEAKNKRKRNTHSSLPTIIIIMDLPIHVKIYFKIG